MKLILDEKLITQQAMTTCVMNIPMFREAYELGVKAGVMASQAFINVMLEASNKTSDR